MRRPGASPGWWGGSPIRRGLLDWASSQRILVLRGARTATVIDLAGPGREKGRAMSAQYVLGVDLGTTFTAAAVAVGDEPPVAVPLGSRAATMPTVAYLGPDGEFLVG